MNQRNWKPLEIPGTPAPKGAYSPLIEAGDFVFVSGQVPTDSTGNVVGSNVTEQTRYTVQKLERALDAAGLTLADVVSISAYLADIDHWDEFDAAYRSCFEPPFPTRTTIGCQLHDVLVEISAVARKRP